MTADAKASEWFLTSPIREAALIDARTHAKGLADHALTADIRSRWLAEESRLSDLLDGLSTARAAREAKQ